MQKIISFNTDNKYILSDEQIAKLKKNNINVDYFNDFSFCPVLVCSKDEKENYSINNVNLGFYSSVKSRFDFQVTETQTIKDFVDECVSFRYNQNDTNALF